jgi:hypothetical protein
MDPGGTEDIVKHCKPLWALAAVSMLGCAASGPTARSPFALVEGKRVGTLELVQDEETGFTRKTRDSVRFDNRYLHTRTRIGFKYPGETITLMNVYDGENLLKSCDEGSYSRTTTAAGGFKTDPASWTMGANGKMEFKSPPGHFSEASEEYKKKYNLECEVAEFKDGLTVELLEGDISISKYRVVRPETGK